MVKWQDEYFWMRRALEDFKSLVTNVKPNDGIAESLATMITGELVPAINDYATALLAGYLPSEETPDDNTVETKKQEIAIFFSNLMSAVSPAD